jgi:hypothetical protein
MLDDQLVAMIVAILDLARFVDAADAIPCHVVDVLPVAVLHVVCDGGVRRSTLLVAQSVIDGIA